MKKCVAFILVILSAFALTACGRKDSYEIQIVIPAGSQEAYVYSEEEISPKGNSIAISAGAGFVDTAVILQPVEVTEENVYEPTYLTQGMPIKLEAEKGGWFKIGVAMQSVAEYDITVSVEVEGVDVRIE